MALFIQVLYSTIYFNSEGEQRQATLVRASNTSKAIVMAGDVLAVSGDALTIVSEAQRHQRSRWYGWRDQRGQATRARASDALAIASEAQRHQRCRRYGQQCRREGKRYSEREGKRYSEREGKRYSERGQARGKQFQVFTKWHCLFKSFNFGLYYILYYWWCCCYAQRFLSQSSNTKPKISSSLLKPHQVLQR